MSKRLVTLLFTLGLLAGTVSAQAPSELLADLDEVEESVFKLKNGGQYHKAQDALSDGLIQLTRAMAGASDDLSMELGARGEVYLELLYILAGSTARFKDLDEVLSKVPDQDPILFALCQYFRMRIQLHLGDLEKARAYKLELGYIDHWQVIGPFNNERGGGFETAFGPEEELDLLASYPGKEREVKWRSNPCETLTGFIDLDALFTPSDQSLAYAVTVLEVDNPIDVALHLGSDEGIKVFLNGREVHALNARRLHHFDQDVVGLHLEAGKNALMLKVCEQTGPWGFSARLTALNGGPVSKVRIVEKPGPFELPVVEGEIDEPEAVKGAVSLFERKAADGRSRAHLYLGLLHQMREYKGENSGLAERNLDLFLKDHPDHVYANYLRAMASTRRFVIAAEKDDNPWRAGLERTLELDPKNVESHVKLGHYYLSSISIPDKALAHAMAAAKVNKEFLPAAYLFADAYKTKRMYARSRKATTALSHKAENLVYPGLRIRLGDVAESDRKIDEAVKHWTAALAHNFLAGEARSRLIDQAAEAGDLERAKSLFEERLALNPYDTAALRSLATMALAEVTGEEAIARLEAILAINPDDDGALKALGDVYHMMGQADEALAYYKTALEINPKAKELRRYVEFLFEDERPFEDAYTMNVQTLVAAHPPGDNADNDSHEYLLLQDVIKVNVDGTASHYHHLVARILNQQGAQRFDYFVTFYTPGEQRCRIKKARIIHPDGAVEEAKIDNASASRMPKQGDMTPAFVDLPPLKPGDLVDVEYRKDDLQQSFFGDYYGYKHFFQPADLKTVYESRLVLLLPSSRKFFFNQRNMEDLVEVTTDEASGREIHTWSLSSLKKLDREREMPGRAELVPSVEVSTYGNWDDFGKWWWNLVEEQMDASDDMRALVAKLTEGLTTDAEKIRAIYNFVVSDIRYNDSWEFGIHGFKPYRATAIFTNRFGDCKDKSILMKALLKQADITCYPVLIRGELPRTHEDLTLPMVSHFNHVISYVPVVDGEEKGLFLDGTAQFHTMEALPEMDRGAKVFVVKEGPGKIVEIAYPKPAANADIKEYTVNLENDGSGVVKVKSQATGFFDAATRRRYLNPGKRIVTLEKSFGSIFGNLSVDEEQFTDVEDLNTPVSYSATLSVKEIMSTSGGRSQLKSVLFPSNLGSLGAEEKRAFDLLLGVPYTISTTLYYNLPAGCSAPVLPTDTKLENDHASFSLTYKKTDQRTVRVRRDIIIKAPRIAAGDYPAFRDLCREAERAEEKLIQITRHQ